MKNKEFISHIKKDLSAIQTNEEHSHGVAELAERFAAEFGMGDWGRVIGLLHDKGKERNSFQQYIRTSSEYDMTAQWHGEDKQHAYIGAVIAKRLYQSAYPMLSYPIMGHHGGLSDYTDFEKKMKEEIPVEVMIPTEVAQLAVPRQMQENMGSIENFRKDVNHIIRLLFSCLVDADYLDTELFMNEEQSRLRKERVSLTELKPLLDNYLKELSGHAAITPLNSLRAQIQQCCLDAATQLSGFFSLTVPTGGGKTLSSLVWAINHAIKYQKKRIIIAIPYTSIVTQTAQILGDIFGQENVLEHHSGVDADKIKDKKLQRQMQLATENWDYPIVVTTNVQLFESILNNKPSACRKLHNIVNSVLILDEVQTLPLDYLQPIVDSLQTYQRLFGVSVLFTTASLPALEGTMKWGRGLNDELHGIPNIHEIVPRRMNLHDKLRRVKLNFDTTSTTYEDLAQRLTTYPRVLCVVNSRKDAKAIFECLPNEGLTLHLSRMMCSAHIRKVIQKIKSALKDENEKVIRIVATQLIEAGVDIDFPVVYRQEAGLDSILQAAGRCNREGKSNISNAYVFRFEKKPFGSIGRACDARENLGLDRDWFAPEVMTDYFIQLYSRCTTFDKAQVKELLYKPNEWCFESVAKEFQFITDAGVTVYVNYGNSAELIERLKTDGPSYDLLKRLSQYSVCIRDVDFKNLQTGGLLEEVLEVYYYIHYREQYKDNLGLVMENHWLEEILTV